MNRPSHPKQGWEHQDFFALRNLSAWVGRIAKVVKGEVPGVPAGKVREAGLLTISIGFMDVYGNLVIDTSK